VVLARGVHGHVATYPTAENIHTNSILDTTIVPARVSDTISEKAQKIARTIAENLDYHGVLAVEMFLMRDGRILVNEIAPRPHNSGHYTLDACATNQFEQQVRTLCGLEPGDTRLLTPVVMVNLLGDVWGKTQPAWEQLFEHPNVKLHLYGKSAPRPGRKMGHFNVLHKDVKKALALAKTIQSKLKIQTL
jgi:5-(carboxyamino)imidazole ribonucleotide synthase